MVMMGCEHHERRVTSRRSLERHNAADGLSRGRYTQPVAVQFSVAPHTAPAASQ
jgi:hypothetical protein